MQRVEAVMSWFESNQIRLFILLDYSDNARHVSRSMDVILIDSLMVEREAVNFRDIGSIPIQSAIPALEAKTDKQRSFKPTIASSNLA